MIRERIMLVSMMMSHMKTTITKKGLSMVMTMMMTITMKAFTLQDEQQCGPVVREPVWQA